LELEGTAPSVLEREVSASTDGAVPSKTLLRNASHVPIS